MKFLKIIFVILVFIFLTILTQIGGLVFILSLSTDKWIHLIFKKKLVQATAKTAYFFFLYTVITFFIVPFIAKPLGRVPLPLSGDLQPLNWGTCFLNRHYVQPELKQLALDASAEMRAKFPGSKLNYLDANFPFIDKFPLIPHLSHNDGKKLDLAFYYKDAKTNVFTNRNPSIIGYGVCEEPKSGEENKPEFCRQKGYWHYSFLMKVIPQGNKHDFIFDAERTSELILILAGNPNVGKIFLEPHLKKRMNLTSEKIRFHGCQAIRHDDHIHIQL